MIIAIDGPAGTGKSTVARGVAERLKFAFFDTGAMYRSMAWWISHLQLDAGDESQVTAQLSTFRYEIKTDRAGLRQYFVSGVDVTEAIRSPEISTLASKIAKYGEVRKSLVRIQREFGHRQNAVFEGRDMGTVVFPDAEVKVFLTASPRVRAERRYRELLTKFPERASSLSLDQLLQEMRERDQSDMTRAVSPLKQAEGAVLIDTSHLAAEQVIEQVVALASPPRRMRIFYGFIYWTARLLFKLFYRLQIRGLSHFRPGAAIIAANHSSHLDPPVVSISCPEEVHFLAKESLFRIPLLGWLIRRLNTHPLSRDASDAATFRQILQILRHGNKVILFPEGSRSPDGELRPIERGLAFLVMKARCAIQPVYVDGANAAWPSHRRWPRLRGRLTVTFGPPILWREFEGLEKREAEARIAERMGQALRDLRATK